MLMSDVVLLAKGETIERCVLRARAALETSPDFAHDFNAQDIAVVNVSRACEACIDIAMRLIKLHKLGLPSTSSEGFLMLAQHKFIDYGLAEKMTRMVGFRNVAVHAYTKIDYDIVASVIRLGLDDVLNYVGITLTIDAPQT